MMPKGIRICNLVPKRYFIYWKKGEEIDERFWMGEQGKWISDKEIYWGHKGSGIQFWKTRKEAEAFLKEWIDKHPKEFSEYVTSKIQT